MTNEEKKQRAKELAKKVGAEVKATIGGHSFYFIITHPSIDPKECVTRLKKLCDDIKYSGWNIVHVGKPRPNNEDNITYLEVTATPGPKCKREECSNSAIARGYCFRHQFLADRGEVPAIDRRTAPPQGKPRYGYGAPATDDEESKK